MKLDRLLVRFTANIGLDMLRAPDQLLASIEKKIREGLSKKPHFIDFPTIATRVQMPGRYPTLYDSES